MCNSTNNIYEIQIEGSWLVNGTNLPLFLAQGPLVEKTEIESCRTKGDIRRFISSLFNGVANSHIAKMALSSDCKALILLPEFFLAKDFWQGMDNLISIFSGPLIIIAGIGFWTEKELSDWKDASENREFGFHTSNYFGTGNRTYNCGCCWIRKENGAMRRIVFVKNFSEQRTEAPLVPSLVQGSCLLCFQS